MIICGFVFVYLYVFLRVHSQKRVVHSCMQSNEDLVVQEAILIEGSDDDRGKCFMDDLFLAQRNSRFWTKCILFTHWLQT